MNRPLKFRVWNKSRNDWLNDSPGLHCFSEYYLDLEGGGLVRFDGSYTDHEERYSRARQEEFYLKGTEIIKESPYAIQQFTGLHDKNNKEIYEGDIVHYVAYCPLMEPPKIDKKFEVKFDNQSGAYNVFAAYDGKFEVIGNIFQNKELLT